MEILNNLILNVDSYKTSHFNQFPPNTTKIFSYIESRGGEYDQTLFFGLQMFLKEYLTKPITLSMINEAELFLKAHGEPFNREGWEHILNKHNGYLPLIIRAVPEGTVVPVHNALVTVENTDPKCFWLTSYIETALLRAVWYPTTVATVSWRIKQILSEYLRNTADDNVHDKCLPFMLHDFGARGVSSLESSAIGGAAHLVNFMGTDNIPGALYAQRYYNEKNVVAYSVPAAEHSSITSWGREREADAYKNMLDQFAKEGSIVSVVSDSYDIYSAVRNIWGEQLKQQVIDSKATLVIRPDSGEPVDVIEDLAYLIDEKFGSTFNSKGYRVFNNVRLLQGDGINESSIVDILDCLEYNRFSAENIVFGMGGALLQHMDRDTLQFAYKASAALIDGKWVDVYKDPITDSGKTSKKGKVNLFRIKNTGEFVTDRIERAIDHDYEDAMIAVYADGKILKEYTLTELRG